MATAVSPTSADRNPSNHLPLIGAAVVGLVGVLVVVLVLVFSSGGHTKVYAGDHDDSTLIGTVARPALQSQGIPVKVMLPHGSALVTVTGPETPGQGLPVQQTYTTTTWSVHVTAATTSVPLALKDFNTLDHGGQVGHPRLVPHTPAPPAVLRAGQSITFQVRESMAVGEGLMRYAPNGTNIEAKWDFEVEND
jgi:hypothetical protein